MKKRGCILITGSSKGLGKEIALIFASRGYDILLHGRAKSDLARTKKRITKQGVKCYIAMGDLRYDRIINRLSDIAREKNINVLVNNAALPCPHRPIERIEDEQIDDILITNLIAPIKLAKKIYNFFLKRGYGAIVNINSLSGLEGQKLRSIYCASKWGLRGFAESLKLEAKSRNVRIIDVYPGRIKTRPELTYGMKAESVARKIFDIFENTSIDKIVLDNRQKERK